MITEDGTGNSLADSYATIAEATAYHASRGNGAWALATATVQASALVRATDYVEAFYRAHSASLTGSQALQFPTITDGLDPRVKRATMLLALEALAGPLVSRVDRGIKATTKALDGVGSTSVTYDDAAPVDAFPAITGLLSPIAALRTTARETVMVGRVTR